MLTLGSCQRVDCGVLHSDVLDDARDRLTGDDMKSDAVWLALMPLSDDSKTNTNN